MRNQCDSMENHSVNLFSSCDFQKTTGIASTDTDGTKSQDLSHPGERTNRIQETEQMDSRMTPGHSTQIASRRSENKNDTPTI